MVEQLGWEGVHGCSLGTLDAREARIESRSCRENGLLLHESERRRVDVRAEEQLLVEGRGREGTRVVERSSEGGV